MPLIAKLMMRIAVSCMIKWHHFIVTEHQLLCSWTKQAIVRLECGVLTNELKLIYPQYAQRQMFLGSITSSIAAFI